MWTEKILRNTEAVLTPNPGLQSLVAWCVCVCVCVCAYACVHEYMLEHAITFQEVPSLNLLQETGYPE